MKKFILCALALCLAAPVLAKTPTTVQANQLLGAWQCEAQNDTVFNLHFAPKQVNIKIDMKIKNDDNTQLFYRIGLKGTWRLKQQTVSLKANTDSVERLHKHEDLLSDVIRETDDWMLTNFQNDVKAKKTESNQMIVKSINDSQMVVRMKGDRKNMTCQKIH